MEELKDVIEDVLGLSAWFVEIYTLFALYFINDKFSKVVRHIITIELGSMLSQILINWVSISAIHVNFFEHWKFHITFISPYLNLLRWSGLLLMELIARKG